MSNPELSPPVGFVGLGNMGGRMARRLVESGTEVVGYDPRPEAIIASGAKPANSLEQLMSSCDVVLLSLPDSKVVESVVLNEHGLLEHARKGQLVVDLSTSAPATTQRLHGLLAKKGCTLMDAGISGGAAAADQGTLTLMVGGDQSALARVRPVLDAFSQHIFHCGDTGTGHTAKLLNNFLNAIALSATSEVMVAGKKAGLDLTVLLDVLNNSSGVNFATLNRFPRIITGDYLEGGLTNALMMKDVSAYVDLVAGLGVSSPNSSGPLASFGLAIQLGYAEKISNTVVDALGAVSGGIRIQKEQL